MCCRKKCFVVFYVFSFPPGVHVGTLNLIASIPGPSIHTSHAKEAQMYTPEPKIRKKMKASATIDAVT